MHYVFSTTNLKKKQIFVQKKEEEILKRRNLHSKGFSNSDEL